MDGTRVKRFDQWRCQRSGGRSKGNREQVRAKNQESLMEIIDNKNLSDAQKQEAVDQLLLMTDLAEKEAGSRDNAGVERVQRSSGKSYF